VSKKKLFKKMQCSSKQKQIVPEGKVRISHSPYFSEIGIRTSRKAA